MAKELRLRSDSFDSSTTGVFLELVPCFVLSVFLIGIACVFSCSSSCFQTLRSYCLEFVLFCSQRLLHSLLKPKQVSSWFSLSVWGCTAYTQSCFAKGKWIHHQWQSIYPEAQLFQGCQQYGTCNTCTMVLFPLNKSPDHLCVADRPRLRPLRRRIRSSGYVLISSLTSRSISPRRMKRILSSLETIFWNQKSRNNWNKVMRLYHWRQTSRRGFAGMIFELETAWKAKEMRIIECRLIFTAGGAESGVLECDQIINNFVQNTGLKNRTIYCFLQKVVPHLNSSLALSE